MHHLSFSKKVRCSRWPLVAALAAVVLTGCASSSSERPPWMQDGKVPASSPASSSNGKSTNLPATVTIQRGDTVYALSRRYGVPVKDIISENKLSPPYALLVGAKISLPKPSVYVVQRGDTLSSIAQSQGVDMKDLAALNNLQAPYGVWVGQQLALPSNKPKTPSSSTIAATPLESPPQSPPSAANTPSPASSSSVNSEANTSPAQQQQAQASAAPPPPPPSSTSSLPPPLTNKAPAAPPQRAGALFAWPVQGRVITAYGPSENGTRNDGINIAVLAGASVRAADNGVVAYAGNELKGFGNLLLIKHAGGWMTAYAHNESLEVQKGDTVKKGQIIAKAGQTGNVDKPQLHFEIRKGANAVNPMDYLEKSSVSN